MPQDPYEPEAGRRKAQLDVDSDDEAFVPRNTSQRRDPSPHDSEDDSDGRNGSIEPTQCHMSSAPIFRKPLAFKDYAKEAEIPSAGSSHSPSPAPPSSKRKSGKGKAEFRVQGYVNEPNLSAGGGDMTQGLSQVGPYKSLFRAGNGQSPSPRASESPEARKPKAAKGRAVDVRKGPATGNAAPINAEAGPSGQYNTHHASSPNTAGSHETKAHKQLKRKAADQNRFAVPAPPSGNAEASRVAASPQRMSDVEVLSAPSPAPSNSSHKRERRKPSPLQPRDHPPTPSERHDEDSLFGAPESANSSHHTFMAPSPTVSQSPVPGNHHSTPFPSTSKKQKGKAKAWQTPDTQTHDQNDDDYVQQPSPTTSSHHRDQRQDMSYSHSSHDHWNDYERKPDPSPPRHTLSNPKREPSRASPHYSSVASAHHAPETTSPHRIQRHSTADPQKPIPHSAAPVRAQKLRMVTVLIEDRRTGVDELAEIKVQLKPDGEGSFWADAQEVCERLQTGPSRIDGPARVYTMRDKYRQVFLRISADGVETSQSANLRVEKDRTLPVFVEIIPNGTPLGVTSHINPSIVANVNTSSARQPLTPMSRTMSLQGSPAPSRMDIEYPEHKGNPRGAPPPPRMTSYEPSDARSPASVSDSSWGPPPPVDDRRPRKSELYSPASSVVEIPPPTYHSTLVGSPTKKAKRDRGVRQSGYESEVSASVARQPPLSPPRSVDHEAYEAGGPRASHGRSSSFAKYDAHSPPGTAHTATPRPSRGHSRSETPRSSWDERQIGHRMAAPTPPLHAPTPPASSLSGSAAPEAPSPRGRRKAYSPPQHGPPVIELTDEQKIDVAIGAYVRNGLTQEQGWQEFVAIRDKPVTNQQLLQIYDFVQRMMEKWGYEDVPEDVAQAPGRRIEPAHIQAVMGISAEWYAECRQTLTYVLMYGPQGKRYEDQRVIDACMDPALKQRKSPSELLEVLSVVYEEEYGPQDEGEEGEDTGDVEMVG
ncbi:hypothetical protein BV25DRAFT_390893 [Artomyces pyxidatus]|uniref:Uncharacterized protein n=1 Tax=Artomyces pyxidatus TaxID=48021 RepID=A0ACB8T3Y6_9AGAM|nr:hypothetical protein BV25DRAFT_390893 [Artomyces pyxidatus]